MVYCIYGFYISTKINMYVNSWKAINTSELYQSKYRFLTGGEIYWIFTSISTYGDFLKSVSNFTVLLVENVISKILTDWFNSNCQKLNSLLLYIELWYYLFYEHQGGLNLHSKWLLIPIIITSSGNLIGVLKNDTLCLFR